MKIDYTTDLWMLTPEHLWELAKGVLSEIHNRITDDPQLGKVVDVKQFKNACTVVNNLCKTL